MVAGERIPPGQHRRNVEPAVADNACHTKHVPGRVTHLNRPEQRLARHARPVRTLAAHQFVLDDDGRAVASLDRVLSGDLAGRPPPMTITSQVVALSECTMRAG